MKIAVPFHNGFVNEHFGHSDTYAIFTVNPDNKVLSRTIVRSDPGCGCRSGIGKTLAAEGVTVMLAGNIGAGAIHHLYTEGIEVVRGCSGPAEEMVESYLKGNITDSGQTCEEHQGCEDHVH